jgi:HD-GYP domain-containing protein (c-di-GMP phosphodiesterase class II)
MSRLPGGAFCDFVRTSCAGLIESFSEALQIPIGVRDAAGGHILTSRAPDGIAGPGISAPIHVHETILGYVVAPPGEDRLHRLVGSLADDIARRFHLHCDMEHMTDQLSQSLDEINLLYEFARILRPDDSFDSNARRLLNQTAELLEHRLLVLAIPGQNLYASSAGSCLSLSEGCRPMSAGPLHLRAIYQDLAKAVMAGEEAGPRRLQGTWEAPHGPTGYIAMPVWVNSALAGFVGLLGTDDQRPAGTGELRLLECLAEQITHIAEKNELNRDLRLLLFNTVKSLVAAIEANDPYTRGHSERVLYFSFLIGERLDLAPEGLRTLSWAALLHDIGKLGMDPGLLNKETRLTPTESREFRDHPGRGCKVLEPILQLRSVLPGIRHHHERFDGTGYPDGLKGEEIPLMSRIIAIADTFDAMTSGRAYRASVTRDDALQEISSVAGTQLDPGLVDVFLDLVLDEAFPDLDWYDIRKEVA